MIVSYCRVGTAINFHDLTSELSRKEASRRRGKKCWEAEHPDFFSCFRSMIDASSPSSQISSYNIDGSISGIGESLHTIIIHEMKSPIDIIQFETTCRLLSRVLSNESYDGPIPLQHQLNIL